MKSTDQIQLAVIGGAQLSVGGKAGVLRGRKAQALVAYLALSGEGSASRELLAGLLWSDVTTQKAKTSLRQTLIELRAAFADHEDCLDIGRFEISLNLDAIEIDIENVLHDLDHGTVPDVLLSRSNLIYSILYGFEDLSEGFRGWLEEYRVRAEQRLLATLQAGYESDKNEYSSRRKMAEAAMLLDPMNENACRALMQLAAQEGDLGTALRAYKKLYTTMDIEMGMEPSAKTQNLIVEIKKGNVESPANETPTSIATATSTVATSPLPSSGTPLLAVLPFRVHGLDPVPDHLADMLVDDIVCKLATLREPVVISNNSTRMFTSARTSFDEVRSRLGANYALCGAIGRSQATYKLAIQLVDTRTSVVIWADAFLLEEKELFLAQSLIANKIADRLVPSMRGTELQFAQNQQPTDLTAYHLTLRARELVFELQQKPFFEAGKLLQLAIEKDASFAPAYTAMADWHSLRMGQGWSDDPEEENRALERTAQTAVRLGGSSGRGLAMLGHNKAIYSREYSGAMSLFERALDNSPNDPETLMWSIPTFAFTNDTQGAIDRSERAISLSPEDPFLFRYHHFASIAHYAAGNYEDAAELGLSSMRRNVHYTSNLRVTAASLVETGKIKKAKELSKIVLEQDPDFSVGAFIKGTGFKDAEKREKYGKQLLKSGLPA